MKVPIKAFVSHELHEPLITLNVCLGPFPTEARPEAYPAGLASQVAGADSEVGLAAVVPGAKCIPLDGAQRNIPVGAETPSMRRRRSLAAGQASPTLALVSVALSALLVGLLPYLTDRPAGSAWLIPTIAWLQGMNSFGGAGLWLPSFAHPFAFSLLTAMALPVYAGWRYGACLGWFAVNAVFELGQLPRVAAWLADSTDQARGHSQLTQALIRYFMQGSFGIDDLAAAASGALCAALVLRLSGAITRDNHAH